jgi:hypothetical protein
LQQRLRYRGYRNECEKAARSRPSDARDRANIAKP